MSEKIRQKDKNFSLIKFLSLDKEYKPRTALKPLQIILSYLAIVFVLLEIPITTGIAYPVYTPFVTEAPKTVSYVIDGIVGSEYHFDIFNDTIGILMLIAMCVVFRNQKTVSEKAKHTVWLYQIPVLFSALFFHLLNELLPFITNGSARFRVCYMMFIIMALSKTLALFIYTRSFLDIEESLAAHSATSVTWIILAFAFIGFGINYILIFFQFSIIRIIYTVIVFVLITLGYARIMQRR